AQRSVMVEATPSPPFEMAEPDLLLELLVIALDAPTQLGGIDQIAERDVFRQGREQIFGRLVLAFGPLDQQPFFVRLGAILMARCDVNPQAGKSRGEPRIGAFPPFDGAPRFRRQAAGEVLVLDRSGGAAAAFLRRPGAAPCPPP